MSVRVRKPCSTLTSSGFFASKVRRFRKQEDGSLIIFSVYLFVMMLIVMGWGIDLMHYERERAVLQSTLDRAVLAAADLDQALPAEDVVEDYFDKAGLRPYLKSVVVQQGVNFRDVYATAEIEMSTQFMHMTGVDALGGSAESRAEERVDSLEISLVLDVSGSMTSNNRLTNLKTAAKEFIDVMHSNTEEGKLSVNIIPYATQVSVPKELLDEMNTSADHDYSHCLNFAEQDFETTAMTRADYYQQTMHFDRFRYFEGRARTPSVQVGASSDLNETIATCEPRADRVSLIMQDDPGVMKAYIDGLVGRGNTSIDIGMKWGAAMLDPAFNTFVPDLVSSGAVPGDFEDLPYDYGESESLKIVVLMTDGENTSQYYLQEGFRTGLSDVFFYAEDQIYSVYDPDNERYYQYPDGLGAAGRWADYPYGQDGPGCHTTSNGGWQCANRTFDGQNPLRLEFPDLWAYTSLATDAVFLYRPWSADWLNRFYATYSSVNGSTKDNRTQKICDTAKDNNIIVFTIGFEAPSGGRVVLKDCASSPSHYYDVQGLEISDAFRSIASSIRKLRLTQ